MSTLLFGFLVRLKEEKKIKTDPLLHLCGIFPYIVFQANKCYTDSNKH